MACEIMRSKSPQQNLRQAISGVGMSLAEMRRDLAEQKREITQLRQQLNQAQPPTALASKREVLAIRRELALFARANGRDSNSAILKDLTELLDGLEGS